MSNHVIIRLIRFVSRFTVHLCNVIYFLTIFSTPYKRFIKILYFAFWDLKKDLSFHFLDDTVLDIALSPRQQYGCFCLGGSKIRDVGDSLVFLQTSGLYTLFWRDVWIDFLRDSINLSQTQQFRQRTNDMCVSTSAVGVHHQSTTQLQKCFVQCLVYFFLRKTRV